MSGEAVWPIDWPQLPANVGAVTTGRYGGYSHAPYDGFNLAKHVGDEKKTVDLNRQLLMQHLGTPHVAWLNQVHGIDVLDVKSADVDALDSLVPPDADASFTSSDGVALAVMTADCLPVLLCDDKGKQIAAVHCGWRSLAGGILNHTLQKFDVPPANILAWTGPAIMACCFEVGVEVREHFVSLNSAYADAFQENANARYQADLALIAKINLHALGVTQLNQDDRCTCCIKAEFFSYRRDSQCGRQASIIYKKRASN